MDGKEIDNVFADAEDKREVSTRDALGMIAKSLSRVADPETSDEDARDAMIRCYKFTKSAASAISSESDSDQITVEKSLVDAIEADGEGVRTEPVSRAVGAIRKRFEGNGGSDDGSEGDDASGDADDATDEGDKDQNTAWQHDLNSDPDPADDWGKDPEF